MDRLFVPFKKEPFQWFKSGEKEWELRGINRNFNEDTVKENHEVELRKGYKGESLWGRIIDVKSFKGVNEISQEIEKEKIIPNVSSEKEFEDKIKQLLSDYEKYIAFRVRLNIHE